MVFSELIQASADALMEVLGLQVSAVGVSADVESVLLLGVLYLGYKVLKNRLQEYLG